MRADGKMTCSGSYCAQGLRDRYTMPFYTTVASTKPLLASHTPVLWAIKFIVDFQVCSGVSRKALLGLGTVPALGHLLTLSVCSVSTLPRTPEFKERIPAGVLWTLADWTSWDSAVGEGLSELRRHWSNPGGCGDSRCLTMLWSGRLPGRGGAGSEA